MYEILQRMLLILKFWQIVSLRTYFINVPIFTVEWLPFQLCETNFKYNGPAKLLILWERPKRKISASAFLAVLNISSLSVIWSEVDNHWWSTGYGNSWLFPDHNKKKQINEKEY